MPSKSPIVPHHYSMFCGVKDQGSLDRYYHTLDGRSEDCRWWVEDSRPTPLGKRVGIRVRADGNLVGEEVRLPVSFYVRLAVCFSFCIISDIITCILHVYYMYNTNNSRIIPETCLGIIPLPLSILVHHGLIHTIHGWSRSHTGLESRLPIHAERQLSHLCRLITDPTTPHANPSLPSKWHQQCFCSSVQNKDNGVVSLIKLLHLILEHAFTDMKHANTNTTKKTVSKPRLSSKSTRTVGLVVDQSSIHVEPARTVNRLS